MTKHIEADKRTGRLSYRRVFPAELRPFIPKQKREHKVSLGAKSLNAEAMKLHAKAQVEYDRLVATARLKVAGTSRPLTEADIVFLAQTYAHRLRKNLSDTHFDHDDTDRDWLTASAWRYAPFAFMDADGAELAGRDAPWTNYERVNERLPELLAHWLNLRAKGDWTCLGKVESFPCMKGELHAEAFHERV